MWSKGRKSVCIGVQISTVYRNEPLQSWNRGPANGSLRNGIDWENLSNQKPVAVWPIWLHFLLFNVIVSINHLHSFRIRRDSNLNKTSWSWVSTLTTRPWPPATITQHWQLHFICSTEVAKSAIVVIELNNEKGYNNLYLVDRGNKWMIRKVYNIKVNAGQILSSCPNLISVKKLNSARFTI